MLEKVDRNDRPELLYNATSDVVSSESPETTFRLGESIGRKLTGGELILLTGGLGAGKTLLTKGILHGLDFDGDEVNSPSFTLVNHYHARFQVFHIDLWRLADDSDAAAAAGLEDLLENEDAIIIVEWAERLRKNSYRSKVIYVKIVGDGDDARQIEISASDSKPSVE